MHVLHHISVVANSKKEAFRLVESDLPDLSSRWSDWYIVGGGRFKDGCDNEDHVLSYKDSKDAFLRTITQCKEVRKSNMLHFVNQVRQDEGEAILMINALEYVKDPDHENVSVSMMLHYHLGSIVKMLMGSYNQDSCYYDCEDHSCSFKYLEERINSNPDDQYLVPVDFHY